MWQMAAVGRDWTSETEQNPLVTSDVLTVAADSCHVRMVYVTGRGRKVTETQKKYLQQHQGVRGHLALQPFQVLPV